MHSETFNCEVITPMFLGDADQKPELRPPSIRGAMRWWFRAMMGGIIGDNITDLKRIETIVFGNNDQSSSITIKCKNYKVNKHEYARLPHKPEGYKAKRNAIDVNQAIKIEVILNPWVSEYKDEIFNTAKYSLFLLLKFGGLGTRSRRGFGSLFYENNLSPKELIKEAQDNFESLCKKINIPKSRWTNIPSFPCIAENYFNVWTADLKKDWAATIIELMEHMSQFKFNNRNTNTENAIGGTKRVNINGNYVTYRQASPLIVHIEKVEDSKYLMTISHFKTILHNKFPLDECDRDKLESYIKNKLNVIPVEIFT